MQSIIAHAIHYILVNSILLQRQLYFTIASIVFYYIVNDYLVVNANTFQSALRMQSIIAHAIHYILVNSISLQSQLYFTIASIVFYYIVDDYLVVNANTFQRALRMQSIIAHAIHYILVNSILLQSQSYFTIASITFYYIVDDYLVVNANTFQKRLAHAINHSACNPFYFSQFYFTVESIIFSSSANRMLLHSR